MVECERGLGDAFLRALTQLAEAKSWWWDVLQDSKLLIGIRKECLDVYWQGQAIFNVGFDGKNVTANTHIKYLLDQSSSVRVPLRGGIEFDLPFDPMMRGYTGNETLQKLKKGAAVYSGPEKQGVHSIACLNSNVIDVEIVLDARQLDTKRDLPRIDIAAIERRDHDRFELVFWEAKRFDNPELRARGDQIPVISQMSEYSAVLNFHRGKVTDAYKHVARNLVAIAEMSGGAREVGAAVRAVADGADLKIGETPKVGLLVFGFDLDQRDGNVWKGHLAKLHQHNEFKILPRGSAASIKLHG